MLTSMTGGGDEPALAEGQLWPSVAIRSSSLPFAMS
jgi:hypothetical protein